MINDFIHHLYHLRNINKTKGLWRFITFSHLTRRARSVFPWSEIKTSLSILTIFLLSSEMLLRLELRFFILFCLYPLIFCFRIVALRHYLHQYPLTPIGLRNPSLPLWKVGMRRSKRNKISWRRWGDMRLGPGAQQFVCIYNSWHIYFALTM